MTAQRTIENSPADSSVGMRLRCLIPSPRSGRLRIAHRFIGGIADKTLIPSPRSGRLKIAHRFIGGIMIQILMKSVRASGRQKLWSAPAERSGDGALDES
ncbi:MAG: hypothetical protein DMF72_10655 [Acidobacteria bacterium]|nr:MAG: hypothetical protein DMF72_10655 [Acidobacteriota bacterium]